MSAKSNKSWRFHLIIAALVVSGLLSILSLVYVARSPVYLPLDIAVKGIEPSEIQKIEFIGEKPFGGDYTIPRTSNGWKGEAAFYKTLRMKYADEPDSSLEISINAGAGVITYFVSDLVPLSGTETSENDWYFSPPPQSPVSFVKKLEVFVLKPPVLFSIVLLVVLILSLLWWKKLTHLLDLLIRPIKYLQGQFSMILAHQGRLVIFCSIVAVVTASLFCSLTKFDDVAGTNSLPDSYDYQAIAVNYAKGGGFPVSGIIYPVEDYKFNAPGEENLNKLRFASGFPSLHRAPLYGFFVGLNYKLFGIHPGIIKYFQLILLCFLGAFLIYIGTVIFGRRGFYSGLLAGVVLIALNYLSAEKLVPGSIFIYAWVMISFFLAYSYFRKPSLVKAALLGVLFASSLLLTYSLVLVPLFIMLWIFIRAFKKVKLFLHLMVCGLMMAVMLLPWSVFVNRTITKNADQLEKIKALAMDSLKTPEQKRRDADLILFRIGPAMMPDTNLSTQEICLLNDCIFPGVRHNGYFQNPAISNRLNKMAFLEDITNNPKFVLLFLPKPNNEALSCHNELMKNGMITPEWRVSDCFYMRQDTNQLGELSRISAFYSAQPMAFFTISYDKLYAAFRPYNAMLALLCLWPGILFLNWRKSQLGRRCSVWRFVASLLIPIIVYGLIYLFPFLFVILLLLMGISLLVYPRITPSATFDRLSGVFIINYIAIIVITYGSNRYIEPLQFLILFMSAYFVFTYIRSLMDMIKQGTSIVNPKKN